MQQALFRMAAFWHAQSFNFPQTTEEESGISACALNNPTKVEVAEYLFQLFPCAQNGPVSGSGSCCFPPVAQKYQVGSATHCSCISGGKSEKK